METLGSLLAIYGAGLLTVLSPCVVPVAPILVGGLVAGEHASRWSRLHASVRFGLGFAVVFTGLGLGLSAALAIGPLRGAFLAVAAIVLGLYGLKMMGLVETSRRLAWMDRSVSARVERLGTPRPLMLGALFALTWTPCAGPVLGGVLTYVASRSASVVVGAAMLGVYSAGVATPLVLLATASEWVVPFLKGFVGPRLPAIERATGAALVALAALVAVQVRPGADVPSGAAAGASVLDAGHTGVQRLLFFHSEHCPTCRAMEALLPRLERACASGRWMLAAIDVDRRENADTVARFDVHAVPTTSLVDESGRETLRLVGFQPETRLRDVLERQVGVACADEPAPADPSVDAMPTCAVGSTC